MLSNYGKLTGLRRVAASKKESLQERRRALREQPGLTFVHRDEFCELLLSFKRMIRSDEPDVNVRGLLDVESGIRYLIEQERLAGCI